MFTDGPEAAFVRPDRVPLPPGSPTHGKQSASGMNTGLSPGKRISLPDDVFFPLPLHVFYLSTSLALAVPHLNGGKTQVAGQKA